MTTLLSLNPITTALSVTPGAVFQIRDRGIRNLTAQFNFTYGSAGTTFDCYLQTSFDGGGSWTDIANFHATTANLRKLINLSGLTAVTTQVTPTDGSMAANTAQDGLIGALLRSKYVSTGTYGGGTQFALDVHSGRQITPQVQ